MRTYKKTILLIAALLGLLGLLLMASFRVYNSCEFANTNIEYVRGQTQKALKAEDFELTKYFAYRALNGIEKTRPNFEDCGCAEAIETINNALKNLKEATKSTTLKDSKAFLKIALQNTYLSIQALQKFEENRSSTYGDTVLVLNTKEVLDEQGGVVLPKGKQLEEKINKSLVEFETSLKKVVAHVNCADAFHFISKIHRQSEEKMLDPNLSIPKKHYHQRIKEITYSALLDLEGCPSK